MPNPEKIDELENVITGRVIAALRKRANAQRRIAKDGTLDAGDKFPNVLIGSPESASATMLAGDWNEIADDLEREAGS